MADSNARDDRTRQAPKRTPARPAVLPADPNAVPVRLGRFTITQVLGEGAFGRVFLAFDPDLTRQVAIKVPHRDGLTAEFRDRFLREARATATIHHRNVCPVYDVGTEGDLPYIVMHYVVGTTLATLLDRQQGPLPPRHALAIARKLAQGMAAAHAKGVVHRDLKPANVLYEVASREVLITDFGLALMASESRVTADGAVCGTPAYMSPEQAKGRVGEVGPASDVYALGVILFRMLTGAVPFRGSVFEVLMQHAEAQPPFPSVVSPGLDPRLDAICVKAMAKRPADRFPSAQALADALTQYLRDDGRTESDAELPFAQAIADETLVQSAARRPPAPLKPAANPPRRPAPALPRRRGRRALAAVFLLLLASGGAAWWFRADLEALVAPQPPVGPGAERSAERKVDPPPPPPVVEVAPPPRPLALARKLTGRWERHTTGSPTGWVWEFDSEWRNSRTDGTGKPFIDPYTVSDAAGDTVSIGTAPKSVYTILRLTDFELEMKTGTSEPLTFKRVPRLEGKWHRHFNKKTDVVVVWEFTKPDKLVWASSPTVARAYKMNTDKLPWELSVTPGPGPGAGAQVYTIEKYSDDRIDMRADKGLVVVLERIKP